ncbi:phosphoglycerate mutase (2,3-diphosphoglycerate-independent) [Candidatus Roizmanbacteria bacterium RIFCSPLOWO2_02_FULL_37_19]|uniref:2,3-bisphosphoglycerate-independent phosphoglycerate mutase n=1 Tax=Candidatus Roizmanbacteria bacterium RIFCSPHIGHO2_02_FULL_37_24 TaxID=1802037 RepID=A0A1F7GXC4_9BACT|nr:MAG: phosphoglycerate mutase (2,3-diphosphoglycerate-independent) [Candidatus Roizmanbacteria bacterium RIFCSPHIGHO2_01_FULL_38_41]OGK23495.1 MAG: phosphoglycerate mutase (2,3-diphosphoglycerate-independent) [Candidatus Roizmanbacteria bacterium RIFCSPHIGHO2_02_FULL_37_24]OGK33453.1 MAG: phosphoglycerate mutase (2,3-diphosphoglycerate-independent) [Candidatus Roizmanbacteria bacterium RIFCSPHIGHO2_12_FULL_37_23]OGK43542.1 MAG: phosphoglycerate mutase (2,3-diphosphoglycerate-independent) [Cand
MRKLALVILDGWGIGKKEQNNAIHVAQTPFFDHLWNTYPKTALQASGEYVGLPKGQIGGSEVGHLTIGSGRVTLQELERINKSFIQPYKGGGVETLSVFEKLIYRAQKKQLHIIGLVSPGGVHSNETHLFELLKILKKYKAKNPYIHFISDGRDTMPKSSLKSASRLIQIIRHIRFGRIATLVGRFYAMDRDTNWDRTDMAFELFAHAQGKRKNLGPSDLENLTQAIQNSYEVNITDEFIEPTIIDTNYQGIHQGDPILFFNFRSDRMKQIVSKFLENFSHLNIFTMTRYDESFEAQPLFEKEYIRDTFSSIIDSIGLTQLKAAETEKGPHVTYFFHGGRDIQFKKEVRTIEQSNRVLHNTAPEMKVKEITRNIMNLVEQQNPDFILVNFANPDMVGHTGDFQAVVDAVEKVDRYLKSLCSYLTKHHYICCITADHGNADFMYDLGTGEKHTAHTLSPVPFIVYDPYDKKNQLVGLSQNEANGLSKITGTILDLMDLKQSVFEFESLINK